MNNIYIRKMVGGGLELAFVVDRFIQGFSSYISYSCIFGVVVFLGFLRVFSTSSTLRLSNVDKQESNSKQTCITCMIKQG